jgi:excinuclease UvrABC helicase subunit UvrB
MSNKEFSKRFEEILKDLFGEKPLGSFFDKIELTDNVNDFKKFMKTSKDGLFTSIVYVFNPESDFKKSNEYPHQKVVSSLQKELDECIKEQDFERAAILRDEIKNLTKNKSKVVELQKELEMVIQEQNFERAIEIRDELKKIN